MAPRVRFAPSPTGYLHVGGARTALFNWLFARRHGGVFVLRIEDTDVDRSSPEMVEGILDGMRWLGLDWDEGPKIGGPYAPYFQSERLDRYRRLAERLVQEGHAYFCYCTPEELKAKREALRGTRGAPGTLGTVTDGVSTEGAAEGWKYDRTCSALPATEIAARERAGQPRAIRFKVPPGTMQFDDLVHGPIAFDGANIEDFVILRSDGHPTYHLSVVSDDIDMGITHVVRGDDHISNTPKQILLYRAVASLRNPANLTNPANPVYLPKFAHVPLILGQDKKRLSKRHGATSVMEYARQGYVPEAMVNFLALLGWSPGNDIELFSRDELVEAFAFEGIGGGNAVFNPEKLDWFNQQHIQRLAPGELARRVRPSFEAAGFWRDDLLTSRHAWFFSVLELFKSRAKRLDDFAAQSAFFFVEHVDYDEAAVAKHLRVEGMDEHLAALDAALSRLVDFDVVSTESTLRSTAEVRGVKAATLIHAVRVAVTGKSVSPGLFEVLALLGRELVHIRLTAAVRVAASVARQ
jgi:glutamyl-tRNA synthetase